MPMVVLFQDIASATSSIVGAVIGSSLLSFGNLLVALSRTTGSCCCIGVVAHIACICVSALFISAICWVTSRMLSALSFSVFSYSALWIDDFLDDVELEVDIIVSLSGSVAREFSIVTFEKSESTLKLSREGQSSSSKSSKFVD